MALKIIFWIFGILITLFVIGIVGILIPDRALRIENLKPRDLGTFRLSDSLPAPTRDYYLAAIGQELPIIDSALLWGRAKIKLAGFRIPIRWKQYFKAGKSFQWLAEITWFGITIFKADDQYIDKRGRMIIGKKIFEGEDFDQGENARLWAEHVYLSSALLSDTRVRWAEIDSLTFKMIYPFNETAEEAVISIDPSTHLITRMGLQRTIAGKTGKSPWNIVYGNYEKHSGISIPIEVKVANGEEFYYELTNLDGIVYNIIPPEEFQQFNQNNP